MKLHMGLLLTHMSRNPFVLEIRFDYKDCKCICKMSTRICFKIDACKYAQ
jgi:hypothetical protein